MHYLTNLNLQGKEKIIEKIKTNKQETPRAVSVCPMQR